FVIRLAEEPVQDETPSNFRLNQNYPNPFNPVTQISYELPQQSDVLLEVYDMTGRQIATLVNETVAAGSHQVSFDAGDLSSGVYLYRLTAGNQVFTRKLTVIK
ncbi:MAG: T9SS type A sorting domain-containing protein, partial [Bacteroidetes bacterium]|nr:T9SS type A sorting domain-containing protein [Bacteroidota bacterium]